MKVHHSAVSYKASTPFLFPFSLLESGTYRQFPEVSDPIKSPKCTSSSTNRLRTELLAAADGMCLVREKFRTSIAFLFAWAK